MYSPLSPWRVLDASGDHPSQVSVLVPWTSAVVRLLWLTMSQVYVVLEADGRLSHTPLALSPPCRKLFSHAQIFG